MYDPDALLIFAENQDVRNNILMLTIKHPPGFTETGWNLVKD